MSEVIEVVERINIPTFPKIELPSEDGLPLESNWHRIQINLLVETVRQHWHGRTDFFAGGNMFIYYSAQQARNREYKGPDFFVVKNVDGTKDRPSWIVWEEDGRLPDVIVELLSPTTAAADLGSKKELYQDRFKTPEYFCYDPESKQLLGWRLEAHQGKRLSYIPIVPNERGFLWSEDLNSWLGLWEGEYQGVADKWVRPFSADLRLIPIVQEIAETERARADAAQAEAARLRAELEMLKGK